MLRSLRVPDRYRSEHPPVVFGGYPHQTDPSNMGSHTLKILKHMTIAITGARVQWFAVGRCSCVLSKDEMATVLAQVKSTSY
jgi:hypothetical protein